MSEKSPAERLRSARDAAGLTQDQAAQLLGVTGKTISRWETGAPLKPKDLSAALAVYEEHAASPDKKVPRSTVRESSPAWPPSNLEERADDFEWAMVRLGANNDEARLIRERIRTFLDGIGKRGAHDPDGELETYLEFGLRPWVLRLIEQRNPPAPIENPPEVSTDDKTPEGPEEGVTPIAKRANGSRVPRGR